jgi:lysylphosphatidylglycerol synthetase-like protein (DUF2156 family)
VGFLGWRGWDRLDDLDRRAGTQQPLTERSILRTQRFMWAITVLALLSAVLSLVDRNWAWGTALVVIAFVSVFTNRRAVRMLRERAARG